MSCATGRPWTEYDDRVLRHLYAHQPNDAIAEILGRTRVSVRQRAGKLGIKKPDGVNAGWFQSGLKPWNKGTNFTAGGNSGMHRFKKGEMHGAAQHNYKPIGSLRVSKDGYLERKVTDDPSLYPARRWVAVHRIVWEEQNGPIPAGHIVVFKPGQRTTEESEVTAGRLECITRRENMMRNTVHRYGPEVFQVIQLRGALNRQIRNKEREHAK